MTWSGIVFVLSFVALVDFLRSGIRIWRSPEYKRKAKMLREQRQLLKGSKRTPPAPRE